MLHDPTAIDPSFAVAFRTFFLARRMNRKSRTRWIRFINSVDEVLQRGLKVVRAPGPGLGKELDEALKTDYPHCIP